METREYIMKHYTPYDGDASFLAEPTARTKALWGKLSSLLKIEREQERDVWNRQRDHFHHYKPPTGLHRQGFGDHRRIADRRAAQAGDHAFWRDSVDPYRTPSLLHGGAKEDPGYFHLSQDPQRRCGSMSIPRR